MSAQAVRAAVQAYFVGQVTGLNQVYRAQPTFADGKNWNLATDLGSGAIGYVHLDAEKETRLTLPYQTGYKQVDYEVGLVVLYQYLIPSNTLVAQNGDEWTDALDVTLDGIKNRLRRDPTLGTSVAQGGTGLIFEAGEAKDDIMIARELPRRSPGKVLSWNVVQFKLTEIVQA